MDAGLGRFSSVSTRPSVAWAIAVLALATMVGLGCDPIAEGEGPVLDHSGYDPVTLEASIVSSAPVIGRPVKILFDEGRLWVSDDYTDPALHVFSAQSGTHLYSLGRRGEGPGDFRRRPSSLHVAPGDDGAVWAWDLGLRRLTRFESRPLSEYEPVVLTLQGGQVFQRMVWVSTGHIVGIAHSEEGRFQVYSPDGQFLRSVPGELLGPIDAPEPERLDATNAGIVVQAWPDHGFVIASMHSGRVEYYDNNAHPGREAKVPFPWDPIFEQAADGEFRFVVRRNAYLSCTTNRDFLFALFSGRRDQDYENEEIESGEFVHVFDWAGDLRAVYRLDRAVSAISVTPSGDVLFASSLSDAHIYRFDLPLVSGGVEPGQGLR